ARPQALVARIVIRPVEMTRHPVPGFRPAIRRTRRRPPPLLLQPLGDKAVAQVDVELAQRTITAVDELVRDASRRDQDVARARLDHRLADGEGRFTMLHDEDLGVWVAVQLRAATGRTIEEDQ